MSYTQMPETAPKFIADENVGKLARRLRLLGYDTVLFTKGDDSLMVARAVAENRVILTRDTAIMKRRLVTSGRLKAILIDSPDPEKQLGQVISALKLEAHHPFIVCLECNHPLAPRSKEEVKGRVPPHVFKTQEQYMECPACHRIYWRGTHWAAMMRGLQKLIEKEAG